jgi:hypothetical protein
LPSKLFCAAAVIKTPASGILDPAGVIFSPMPKRDTAALMFLASLLFIILWEGRKYVQSRIFFH